MKRFLPTLLPVLLLAGCTSNTVTPQEKADFITASDLVSYGYNNPRLPEAKWSRTDYGSGDFDIDYKLETPESEDEYPLYIGETLSEQGGTSEAITFLAADRATMNLSLKSEGITEKSVADQVIYGDGSNLTLLQKDGITVGNIFSARKGGRTFSMTLVGTGDLFETGKEWDDFAGKKINTWLSNIKNSPRPTFMHPQ